MTYKSKRNFKLFILIVAAVLLIFGWAWIGYLLLDSEYLNPVILIAIAAALHLYSKSIKL